MLLVLYCITTNSHTEYLHNIIKVGFLSARVSKTKLSNTSHFKSVWKYGTNFKKNKTWTHETL